MFGLLVRLFLLKVIVSRWKSDRRAGERPPSRTAGRRGPVSGSRPRSRSPGASGHPVETGEPVPPQTEETSGPDTPLALQPPDWKVTLKRTLQEIKGDRVTMAAAGMAYYFFLAIFPAMIAVVGIMGLADIDSSGLVRNIRSALPGDAGVALTTAFAQADQPSDSTSLTAAILGIAVALWSASSGMVALQSGLNIAYDVPEDRKFIGKRAIALLLIVATVLLGGVPSPLFTLGDALFFEILGWVLTVVAVVVLFSVFYYIGPNRESPRWQWVSTGGVVGAALWITILLVFGYYVNEYGNYSKTYGSLAGVIVLILLLFLTSLVVLIGGELNSELERQASRRAAGAKAGG